MPTIGMGKTGEGILITPAFLSERIGAATIYYNGQPFTNASGYGFDSQPFDDVVCAINVGTVQGALATLINAVYESDTDDPSAATAIDGADFSDLVSTTDETMERGEIACKGTKRYLFLRTETQGEPLTADFSANWVAGQARSQVVEQTLTFDV